MIFGIVETSWMKIFSGGYVSVFSSWQMVSLILDPYYNNSAWCCLQCFEREGMKGISEVFSSVVDLKASARNLDRVYWQDLHFFCFSQVSWRKSPYCEGIFRYFQLFCRYLSALKVVSKLIFLFILKFIVTRHITRLKVLLARLFSLMVWPKLSASTGPLV